MLGWGGFEVCGALVSELRPWWCEVLGAPLPVMSRARGAAPPRARGQVAAAELVWRQNLRMLGPAPLSRHSERAADRPRRRKWSKRRLNLVSPKIGSIMVWGLAESSPPAAGANTRRMNA